MACAAGGLSAKSIGLDGASSSKLSGEIAKSSRSRGSVVTVALSDADDGVGDNPESRRGNRCARDV